jgi:hypothetical protein
MRKNKRGCRVTKLAAAATARMMSSKMKRNGISGIHQQGSMGNLLDSDENRDRPNDNFTEQWTVGVAVFLLSALMVVILLFIIKVMADKYDKDDNSTPSSLMTSTGTNITKETART